MTGPGTGERILVVDDEPDIVALVVYHLAKAGYRVSSATSGPDALQLATRDRPALIVLDLMLPGLSGFDVLARLREEERTAKIAVLMLTARKEEPDRIRGLQLGADDYLTKPFSPQELVLRVSAILRRVAGAGELAVFCAAIAGAGSMAKTVGVLPPPVPSSDTSLTGSPVGVVAMAVAWLEMPPASMSSCVRTTSAV